MDKRHITPREGLRVPDHERGGYLPPEGRTVRWDTRWARWLREGSIAVDTPKTKKTAAKAAGKEKG